MSLETTIADLVSAANNLTSAVNGKMGEIDQKVDEAVQGVPAEIIESMGRKVYLDPINGDDSNFGESASKAVKSFSRISDITPSGASVEIRVLEDYTFGEGERANFESSDIFIRTFGETRRKLFFTPHVEDGENRCKNLYAFRNCFFNFYDIEIHFPDPPLPEGAYSQSSAIIGSHSGAEIGTPLSIRMRDVAIEVPSPETNEFNLTPGYGMVMLSTGNVTVPSAWANAGRVFRAYPPEELITKTRLMHDNSALIPSVHPST